MEGGIRVGKNAMEENLRHRKKYAPGEVCVCNKGYGAR